LRGPAYLIVAEQAYRRRHGHYPKVICADQIYRTRSNRAFCQRHGIRLSGPRLGRTKNDPELVAADKKQFIDDQRQRNAVEKARVVRANAGLAWD
jgi:IS5 family transposase